MLRIAICDDMKSICSEIEQMILNYGKINNIDFDVEVFYQGEDLLRFIKHEHTFDLILLDIELVTTTGVAVSQTIRNQLDDHVSKIIFITAKDGYERELFDVQPFNFLKKPIECEKLFNCLELAIKICCENNQSFEFKKGYDVVKYELRNIVFFEKIGRKIYVVTDTDEDLFYDTLSNVKKKLPEYFIKPHSSFLVNFEKIFRTTKNSIVMSNNKEIPVSQRNLKYIREILLNSERKKISE